MKRWIKLFLILLWIINVEAGEKTDWWVELINDNGTIIKVKRCDYLEYKEMLNPEYLPEGKEKVAYFNQYTNWEHNYKYDKSRN